LNSLIRNRTKARAAMIKGAARGGVKKASAPLYPGQS